MEDARLANINSFALSSLIPFRPCAANWFSWSANIYTCMLQYKPMYKFHFNSDSFQSFVASTNAILSLRLSLSLHFVLIEFYPKNRKSNAFAWAAFAMTQIFLQLRRLRSLFVMCICTFILSSTTKCP